MQPWACMFQFKGVWGDSDTWLCLNKSHLIFSQSRIVSPSSGHECIMWVFTTVVSSFGRCRNFRGTRIGLPTSEKTGHKHLFPFQQHCPRPCWREFWLLGGLGVQPFCCSELCRSLSVPHWSLSVRLSGDGLKVWLVLPLWPGLSVHPGLLPWRQGHLPGRVYKARLMFIWNDLFVCSKTLAKKHSK